MGVVACSNGGLRWETRPRGSCLCVRLRPERISARARTYLSPAPGRSGSGRGDLRRPSHLSWSGLDTDRWILAIDLDLSRAGLNPLVLWRGDRSDISSDNAPAFLRARNVPVWAFVDYDPSGLLIAAGLPRLAGIIAPEPPAWSMAWPRVCRSAT
ncbi:DUF7281 domain-containing protein [Thiocapsa roseopersicina]|uniref:DUF7281 domain-containing protein n=1 Tax=Thiocapsa roseopersicina TaxID=1058 RepID=UPI003FCD4C27